MAGYSENREQNLEIKYLRKVLGGVEIPLPDSLRGDALIHKLNGIPAPKSKEDKMRLIFPEGWLNLRSGLTCAAALLIMFTLVYNMGVRLPNDMVTGEIPIPRQTSVSVSSPEKTPEAAIALIDEAGEAQAGGQDIPAGDAVGPEMIQPFAVTADEEAPSATLGVGGNPSARLGELNGYALAYRGNDAAPERMEEAPFVLELWDETENAIVAQADIPRMTEIKHCFTQGSAAAVVGTSPDGVMTCWISFEVPGEPSEPVIAEYAGKLVDASVYDGILHVVSYAEMDEEAERDNPETVTLPDSLDTGICVIAAVNLSDGSVSQKSFAGAGTDIKLYKLSAYIQFQEGPDKIVRYAKIKFSGTAIDLEEIS